MKRHHVRKVSLLVIGALFIAFGLGAFVGVPGGHDSSHHTIGHNLTHVFAGLSCLAIAWAGSSRTRRGFCFGLGAVYFAIGVLGVFSSRHSLTVLPGLIEFDLEDSWIQIGTGLLFFGLGLLKRMPRRYGYALAT